MNCRNKKGRKKKECTIHFVSDTKLPKVIMLTGGRNTSKEGNWYPIPEEAKTDKKEYLKGIITKQLIVANVCVVIDY